MPISKLKASSIASGTIDNARISLDAAEIPALPTSKITSGTFADARIASSNVSQHATSFDDNKLVNDLSTLGLRVHTQENLNATNTNSQYVDVFQDTSGYTNGANTSRNASEYVSSITSGADPNLVSLFRPNTTSHSTSTSSISSLVSGDSATLAKVNTAHGGNNLNSSPQKFSGSMNIRATTAGDGGWKINPTTAYNFGTNDFTIEAWTYNNNATIDGNHRYIFDWSSNSNNARLSIGINNNENWFGQTIYNGGFRGVGLGALNGFANGTWTHWAFVKDSGNLALFADGHRQATYSDSLSYNWQSATTGDLSFGQRHASDTNGNLPNMFTQEIRISNNARYASSGATYTIPSAQFSTTAEIASATGNFTCPNITAASATTKMGAVITYQNQSGTNALNTDIVLQLSADGGSNYSTATLTALPDFSTGIKMAKVNDLTVTSGTQLKYKISFANQASGSKEARIRGVSLNY